MGSRGNGCRPRTRLPVQILSITVTITPVIRLGSAIAAPVPVEAPSWEPVSATASISSLITAFGPGTRYVIRITLDDGADFKVEVYAESDASTYANFKYPMTVGKNWRFRHWAYRGNTYLDNYLEWSGTQLGAFTYGALKRLESAEATGSEAGCTATAAPTTRSAT